MVCRMRALVATNEMGRDDGSWQLLSRVRRQPRCLVCLYGLGPSWGSAAKAIIRRLLVAISSRDTRRYDCVTLPPAPATTCQIKSRLLV